jgi:hypothetical protein
MKRSGYVRDEFRVASEVFGKLDRIKWQSAEWILKVLYLKNRAWFEGVRKLMAAGL